MRVVYLSGLPMCVSAYTAAVKGVRAVQGAKFVPARRDRLRRHMLEPLSQPTETVVTLPPDTVALLMAGVAHLGNQGMRVPGKGSPVSESFKQLPHTTAPAAAVELMPRMTLDKAVLAAQALTVANWKGKAMLINALARRLQSGVDGAAPWVLARAVALLHGSEGKEAPAAMAAIFAQMKGWSAADLVAAADIALKGVQARVRRREGLQAFQFVRLVDAAAAENVHKLQQDEVLQILDNFNDSGHGEGLLMKAFVAQTNARIKAGRSPK